MFNPRYADFARHHRFEITPCNVGAGHEKGRVEARVGYVKKNFLAGLDIPDFRTLNTAARHWLDTVANVRVHGETHDRLLARQGTNAVVDERLRVRGVGGLRVADASVMPVITSRNTNAPAIMSAEKAADMARADAARRV